MLCRMFALGLTTTISVLLGVRGVSAQEKKPIPNDKPMATINGIPITFDELKAAAGTDLERLETQRLQFETHYARGRDEILRKNLEDLVEARLLAAEAARLGITERELLARDVEGKVKQPTAQDVDEFFEANRARIQQAKEKVQPQIQKYLEQQALSAARSSYIRELKSKYQVVTYLEPLRSSVQSAGFPSRGSASAEVTLVEFSDFQCTYCRALHGTLQQILKNYPDTVRIVFRNYPLDSIHSDAQKAAEAALCAGEQERFWEMHDAIFEDQGNLKSEQLKARAADLGLDAEAFSTCLDSGRQAGAVRRDLKEGAALGVNGTPAIFINGRFLSGARPYTELAKIIDEELERGSMAVTDAKK